MIGSASRTQSTIAKMRVERRNELGYMFQVQVETVTTYCSIDRLVRKLCVV